MKSTRKHIIIGAFVLLLSLSAVSIANAITYGAPDEDGHPYVGLVLFYNQDGEYEWRCSGTLLSPTIFLTAGHCTFGTYSAKVLFDADLSELEYPYPDCGPYDCYAGTPYNHPDYDDYWSAFPNTFDVGIVELKEPIPMEEVGTYGVLSNLHVLDELATRRGHQDRIFRTVGYGDQSVKPQEQFDRVRYTSTSMLINLRSALTDGYNLHTSNNPGKGHGTSGGSCFGDSGGPVFYPEYSNTVVAVVSFGMNWNCKGSDWSYRVDIEDAQEFILRFLDD